MPKYVCTGPIPHRLLRRFCHANYDRLMELAEKAAAEGPLDEIAEEFSAILHDIRVDGFRKRTEPGRLEAGGRLICDRLKGTQRDLEVLDIGGSDGITTLDLVERLEEVVEGSVEGVLADKFLQIVRCTNGVITEYRTTDHQPLLVRMGRIGVRLPRSEHPWALHMNLVGAIYQSLTATRDSLDCSESISLINPLVDLDPRITTIEMDVTRRRADLVGRFEVVRASNVLNPKYFPGEALVSAVENCWSYLAPDGILLVSRNHDEGSAEIERGTLFHKGSEGRADVIDLAGGSEIRDTVEQVVGYRQ